MPDRRERLRAEAWRWHTMAAENLLAAEHIAADTGLPLRIACFWAQQAGELAVKAVLVAEDVDPPKTHDLVALVARCPVPQFQALDTQSLNALSEWAVGSRYPADVPDAGPDLRDRLLATARQLVAVASGALAQLVGPPVAPDERS